MQVLLEIILGQQDIPERHVLKKIQLLCKDYDLPLNTSPNLTRKFGILVVQTQKYYYSCKMLEKTIFLNWSQRYLYNGKLKNANAEVNQFLPSGKISDCVVPENIPTPTTEGISRKVPPPPRNFHFLTTKITPPPLRNFHYYFVRPQYPLEK